jgi:ribosomal protein S18 acetylase RimI-like enzyme
MSITLATRSEIGRIMSLIKDCIKDMESQGIYQWNEYYPTLKVIQDDIENGSMHILKESDEVVGIITVNEEQDPEWSQVNWSTQKGKVLAIHRLAVNPKWQNRGIGVRLLDFAEAYAAKNMYTSIRLDSYSGNPGAIRLYEGHGYKRVGQVHFPGRELPFYCYDKILK